MTGFSWYDMESLNHDLISLGFFFTILIVSLSCIWWEKRRLRHSVAHPQRTAPIGRTRMSRKKTVVIGVALAVFGMHSVVFVPISIIYTIMSTLMGIVGIVLLLMLFTGRAATGWIEMQAEMFMSGSHRGYFTVDRSNIEGWWHGEFGSSQVILIRLKNRDAINVFAAGDLSKYEAHIKKNFQTNENLVDAHIFIVPGIYNAPADEIIGTMLQLYGEASTERIHPPESS